MKTNKRQPEGAKTERDVLEKIESFIEDHIENNLKKGLDEVEKFLKRELRELRERRRDDDDDPEKNPFSYVEAFLRDRKVASVAPSTKFLVGRVMKRIDWASTRVIVEYGAAEGVMTREMLKRLPANGKLVAVELNKEFMGPLSKMDDPRLTIINGSVLEIDRLLAPLGVPPADVIVSGIPFSFLKPIERHQLLHKTVDALAPKGRFVAYQVTTHLVPLMKYHFEDTDIEFEVRNLPPHFVFTGYK